LAIYRRHAAIPAAAAITGKPVNCVVIAEAPAPVKVEFAGADAVGKMELISDVPVGCSMADAVKLLE
jgi:hypothetical protein